MTAAKEASAKKSGGKPAANANLGTIEGQFQAARRCGTPLLAISTPDAFASQARLMAAVEAKEDAPVFSWDLSNGLVGLNNAGKHAAAALPKDEVEVTPQNPTAALVLAFKLPGRAVLFFHLANRLVGEAPVLQAIANLRDTFKQDKRTLVLLSVGMSLPPEIAGDIISLDEPLPGRDRLETILKELHAAAKLEAPSEEVLHRAIDAVMGLPAFQAEQCAAMCLTKQGLDVEALWERKRKQVEQTPGLSVDKFPHTFADIGGLSQAKEFGSKLFAGPRRPQVICRIEEIEKVMAGAASDTSGVSQDALQVILNSMEDHDWTGIIAYGPPGSGKSLYSKALAATFGALSMAVDFGAMKGSLVGASEGAVRTAMKVISAVGGGRVFFVATANKLDTLPPELRRRFRYGVWMFDSPDAEERRVIWKIWKTRYEIPDDDNLEDDAGLTGADIRNICELGYSLGCSLQEAMKFTAPICKTSPEVFKRARDLANGRFLSASYPGLFRLPADAETYRPANITRHLDLEEAMA